MSSTMEEDIYMSQPAGFTATGEKGHLLCQLNKSLYGLKQAPIMWYLKFDSYIQQLGYYMFDSDPCMCTRQLAFESWIYLILYVDDMLLCRDQKTKADPSQQICNEGTRISLTHIGHADRAKLDNKDPPTLLVRLHTKGVEALQHGECEANINSASPVNPTIGQRLSIHRRGEKAQWKDTLCIGRRKYHVRNGGEQT